MRAKILAQDLHTADRVGSCELAKRRERYHVHVPSFRTGPVEPTALQITAVVEVTSGWSNGGRRRVRA